MFLSLIYIKYSNKINWFLLFMIKINVKLFLLVSKVNDFYDNVCLNDTYDIVFFILYIYSL